MLLLMRDPRVNLLMVSYVEADSLKDIAVNTTLKLMHFTNNTRIPVGVSTLQLKNPFPLLYRAGPLAADVLPVLNPPGLQLDRLRSKAVRQQPGQDALTELLLKQQEPVTVVATGGCGAAGSLRVGLCRGFPGREHLQLGARVLLPSRCDSVRPPGLAVCLCSAQLLGVSERASALCCLCAAACVCV
jgi:hypothetical protein